MKDTLESQQLRVFVTLARTLSMGRAAAALRLTPSGVSRCLKALEDELGCRLLERTTRRTALTGAGRDFLVQAEDLLNRMHVARARMRARSNLRNGHLRVGVVETLGRFVLPAALREFRESFPGFTLKIEVCRAQQAAVLLADGCIDLALLPEPEQRREMKFELLAEDDLNFVVHPLHPWAVQRRVGRESFDQTRFILPSQGHSIRDLLDSYFRSEGIEIRPFVEIDNTDAIRDFARLNIGVGVLPRWMIADDQEQGAVLSLPLGRRRLRRRWGALYSASHELGFAESLFIRICRNVLRELVLRAD